MALTASSAWAEPITVQSDQIIISADGRTATEFGTATCTSPSQTTGCFDPIDQIILEGGETATPLTHFIGFRPSTPTNPHGSTFNTAVELLEADGTISDIIEFVIVAQTSATGTPLGQSWTLKFFSDTDSGPLTLPADLTSCTVDCVVSVQETGGLQDISGLFLNSDGVTRLSPLFNVNVQSDVPDPSSLLLLAAGFGLVLLCRGARVSSGRCASGWRAGPTSFGARVATPARF